MWFPESNSGYGKLFKTPASMLAGVFFVDFVTIVVKKSKCRRCIAINLVPCGYAVAVVYKACLREFFCYNYKEMFVKKYFCVILCYNSFA